MTENTTEQEKKVDQGQEPWFYQFKKVLLAGMGAVAMAQEEMEGFVGKMVEKGEIAEQEGKKLVKEFMDRGRQQTKDTVNLIEENGIESLSKIFSLLNIPSKKISMNFPKELKS